VLQMVRAICRHSGLQNIMADKEVREVSENSSIESLSQHWKIACPRSSMAQNE